ncbi:MAG: hypothetical protein EIB84_00250 (plasmid) [Spiroplasma poulsonii]|uniref:Uncharacterized protein n=4 Tax=Spiroplasma poulsonii TaxID=2138 RepID=A0A2P6FEW7_9MOLU|nr:hypothetical protein [Spiroplasma poulsonii]UXX42211.1 hypothetical protein [Spiroplasma phage MaM-2019a]KAF0850355.1 P58 [Spiroplasma poulsonii]MBW1241353.1 hypothetical protein [Spiroplasma poulsonii]PQM29983.1 hypothetical protein SMSRO_SF028660 [Spiroplasma poulsonii]PQM30079.1 hypothetical protein SMSRO_SF025510 [Spiroplasma poulsonii]
MKEFNPKTASLRTFERKIEQFWRDKLPNIPYTLNDLTNKFNLSNRWRYENYKSEKIVPLLERQIDKIESELIKQMVKTPEGTRLYWQRAFNHKYSLQEKQLEQELNLNNQQPIIVNLQTDIRDIKKESDNNA